MYYLKKLTVTHQFLNLCLSCLKEAGKKLFLMRSILEADSAEENKYVLGKYKYLFQPWQTSNAHKQPFRAARRR